ADGQVRGGASNILIEYRYANADPAQMQKHAAELGPVSIREALRENGSESTVEHLRGRDSQISNCVTRERSACGGTDRCDATDYETTNGIGSRIFFRAVKAMLEAPQKIIACSSKPCSTGIERAVPGVIYPSGLATGNLCTSASADGPRAAFSIAF